MTRGLLPGRASWVTVRCEAPGTTWPLSAKEGELNCGVQATEGEGKVGLPLSRVNHSYYVSHWPDDASKSTELWRVKDYSVNLGRYAFQKSA
jgi:hypothetical protein